MPDHKPVLLCDAASFELFWELSEHKLALLFITPSSFLSLHPSSSFNQTISNSILVKGS